MATDTIPHVERPTSAFTSFSYVAFGASVLMVAGGIAYLPLDWWVRGYFAIGVAMIIQSCFTLAKNIRDIHESSRMINRIDEARTERLLRTE